MDDVALVEAETPDYDSLVSLIEKVVIYLPGCSDAMVRVSLREAYREFCEETDALQVCVKHVIVPQPCNVNLPPPTDVPIIVPRGTFARRVLSAKLDGVDVSDKVEISPSRNVIHLPREWVLCQPRHFLARVSCVPKPSSEEAPISFITRHGDDLCQGVLAKLCEMDNKPWTNKTLAARARSLFDNAKSVRAMETKFPLTNSCISMRDVL